MANVVVVGSQWGDEGKGKIVDWLSERADVVVRFQGGHNAGHTLVIDGTTYKLSMLPSGIVRKGKLSIIGNGVVIDPWALMAEISKIREVVDSWKLTVYPELCHGHLGIVNIRGQILPVINPFNHSVTQTAPLPGERLIILEGPSKDGFCVVVKQVQKVVLDSENPDQNSTVNINGRPVKIVTEPDLYEYFGVQ